MKLIAQNVHEVFMDCLYTEKEVQEIGKDNIESAAVKASGVMVQIGFNKERLEKHREDIASMLDQLPEPFKHEVGGGWSFLNACQDAEGNQWGEQQTVDQLLCLGLATGKAKYCIADRKLWSMLPGGVPYFEVM